MYIIYDQWCPIQIRPLQQVFKFPKQMIDVIFLCSVLRLHKKEVTVSNILLTVFLKYVLLFKHLPIKTSIHRKYSCTANVEINYCDL